MSRKQLYLLVFLAVFTACIWFVYSEEFFSGDENNCSGVTLCLFKRVTGLPCPSCGVTRAVLALFNGQWKVSLLTNPLGIIVLLLFFILPVWVGCDLIRQRKSFWIFYRKAEDLLRRRFIAVPLILLVMANWLWNIYKHL